MPARCVPIEEACKYVGCKNVDQFRREVRLGKWPGPIQVKSRPLRWDIKALDAAEIREGYMSAERGDPEPGPNRGKAFWHGWRNRMIDLGEIKHNYILE